MIVSDFCATPEIDIRTTLTTYSLMVVNQALVVSMVLFVPAQTQKLSRETGVEW